jgi:hypothetical protein
VEIGEGARRIVTGATVDEATAAGISGKTNQRMITSIVTGATTARAALPHETFDPRTITVAAAKRTTVVPTAAARAAALAAEADGTAARIVGGSEKQTGGLEEIILTIIGTKSTAHGSGHVTGLLSSTMKRT